MEHLDVAIVGAGLSGVGAGGHLQIKCPWASYAIFEARDAIGGTWDLFRYPGIRSDSDMYTLGYSFRPWPFEQAIADGASIRHYIQDTAAETGVDRHIRFNHRVVRADWRSDENRWHLVAERTDGGGTVELTCGFLFSCTGYYRYDRGYLPEFEGMDSFEGTLVHPQAWPEDLDYGAKRIVVVGSGATAITLVPALARTAAHVTMLQRSPSWIAAVPSKTPVDRVVRRMIPARYEASGLRWLHALLMQGFYELSRRRPKLVKRLLREGVRRHLPEGYDVRTHFTPKYDPWDQRLCVAADGDLFEAISTGAASVVTDQLERFTKTGVQLCSGEELEADIVVTATGLDLLFMGGIEATLDGEHVDVPAKLIYKGMMLEGVPNLAFAVGYTNASWTLKCDLTADYVCRLLNSMRDKGFGTCTPVNHGASVTSEPLLGLSSGYIQRAAHRFPRQGSRLPWRVRQSYLGDYRALRLGRVDDDAMVFSYGHGVFSNGNGNGHGHGHGHGHGRTSDLTSRRDVVATG